MFYTSLNADATDTATATALNRLRHGTSSIVRDILSYEQQHNVDQHVAYGFETISPDCAAQWPVDDAGPAQYTGVIDSHPYSVAVSGRHHYIADAAANAIFDVSSSGHIRTVAVLPPQPSVVTAEARRGGAPARRASSVSRTTSSRCRPTSRSVATERCT